MSVDIKVPVLPESVADAAVAVWHKQPGDSVTRGDVLVELETDKVMLEVPAPDSGVLTEIKAQTGSVVTSDQVLAVLDKAATTTAAAVEKDAPKEDVVENTAAATTAAATATQSTESIEGKLSPAVRRLLQEHALDPRRIQGTGRAGRLTKQDVLDYIKHGQQDAVDLSSATSSVATAATDVADHAITTTAPTANGGDAASMHASSAASLAAGEVKRVPMSRLRARIAQRLLESQRKAAMLSTFNEVNMQAIMDLRARHKQQFEKTHGVKLGLSSFFVKAATLALQQFPVINASIDGNDVVYHNFVDIGVAVGGGPRGLVVPVLRHVQNMSLAEIEQGIRAYAERARAGKITLEDMQGGTFTITNGGVYGSMLSTPIINPPQSAILGMHNIMQRPIVENGSVVARPMMYLALSYDHCLIDGEQAVRFLVAIKQALEDPAAMLLGL